jgi:hypothetical protein
MGVQFEVARCQGTLNVDNMVAMKDPCVSLLARIYSGFPTVAMWIENSPHFVNQPGDWALDSSKGLLYYIPRPTEDLNSAEILIPQITTLIEANGITNIAFVGIEFTHSNWLQASTDVGFVGGFGDGYWSDAVPLSGDQIPAAITCLNCKQVLFMDSQLDNLGTTGIRVDGNSTDNIFFHNYIHHVSGSGIRVGSDGSTVVSGTVIEDNTIAFVGQEYLSSVGITQIIARNSTIRHNDIHDVPYSGITVGWGDSPNSHDILVNANHIYNAMLILQDGGGIYFEDAQPDSSISHNYIHDLSSGMGGVGLNVLSNGIYLDSGSAHITINNNIVRNSPTYDLWLQNVVPPFPYDITITSDGVDAATVIAEAGVRQLPGHPH